MEHEKRQPFCPGSEGLLLPPGADCSLCRPPGRSSPWGETCGLSTRVLEQTDDRSCLWLVLPSNVLLSVVTECGPEPSAWASGPGFGRDFWAHLSYISQTLPTEVICSEVAGSSHFARISSESPWLQVPQS